MTNTASTSNAQVKQAEQIQWIEQVQVRRSSVEDSALTSTASTSNVLVELAEQVQWTEQAQVKKSLFQKIHHQFKQLNISKKTPK